MTEHALMPDEFRTMAACEAFGTMLPVFERYNSLVTLMIREIIRSVYEVRGRHINCLTILIFTRPLTEGDSLGRGPLL